MIKIIDNISIDNSSYNDEIKKISYKYKKTTEIKRKWRIMFEYFYDLYREDIKFINYEKFFVKMTIKDFKKIWKNQEEIIDNLYEQYKKLWTREDWEKV